MPRKNEPKWWQYAIAYTVFTPLVIIIGSVLFFIAECYIRTFGRGVYKFFEANPHTWFTSEQAAQKLSGPPWLNDLTITYLDVTGSLEHRLSTDMMDKLELSELRRNEVYEFERRGVHQAYLYEYRLYHSPGSRRKISDLARAMSSGYRSA